MKALSYSLIIITLLSASFAHAERVTDYDSVPEAYGNVGSASAQTISMLPISPFMSTTITSEGNAGKMIEAAKEDAAYYLASGQGTARLHSAIQTLRNSSEFAEATDQELAELIVSF